ncbi:MAG: aldo/keto reductase [Bryobacteraceae bacterium]|nr:aldo/keto reductase [Bryobacteraceae bacterium]
MTPCTRRRFLHTSLGVTALPAFAQKRAATDWVPLGNSGVKVTRLAFGTGTHGGRVQRELGQDQFTRLVRHAYDSGIRFFESADNYEGMHEMLAIALKGIPRDSYRLMTKLKWRETDNPAATLDRFRQELNSEYFDIVLMHNVRTPGWPTELERLRDGMSELKHKKVLLAHGASVHGLLPLRAFPGTAWLDVALCRINHNGARMDSLKGDSTGAERGDVTEVTARLKQISSQGTGVIGMKLVGEGMFRDPEDREAAVKYVLGLGTVNAMTMGFKSPAEVDEAIARINRNLNG